jgi:hypothetical protein
MNATPPRCNTIARGPRDAVTAGVGGIRRYGVGNEAERRPARRRNLEMDLFEWEPLQPLEIPQSFLWKCLERNRRVLEKLAIKFWRSPLFRHLRRRSRTGRLANLGSRIWRDVPFPFARRALNCQRKNSAADRQLPLVRANLAPFV